MTALAWLVGSAILLATATAEGGRWTSQSSDSSVRMVQVEDLVGGQAWWDLTQYRAGFDGVDVHWSRHVDVLVAPFLAADVPYLITTAVVPLLLFGVFLGLAAVVGWHLGGPVAAGWAPVVGVFAPGVFTWFRPGAMDHHGLQAVLLLASTLVVLARGAVGRGLGAAALVSSLVVGLENAGPLIALLVFASVAALTRDRRERLPLVIGLSVGMLVSAVGLAPPDRLLTRACDVFALSHALGVLGLLALLVLLRPISRLVATGLVGGVGLFAVAVRPACAIDPYADVPSGLWEVWLASIGEAGSIVELFATDPRSAFLYLSPLFVVLVWLWVRTSDRDWTWSATSIGVATVAATVVMVLQARAQLAVAALAVPLAADAIARLAGRLETRGARLAVPVLVVLSGGLWAPVVFGALGSGIPAETLHVAGCLDDLAAVGSARPGLIVGTTTDLGGFVLDRTGHRILAIGLHRAVEPNLANWTLLSAPESSAPRTLSALEADYLMVCDTSPVGANVALRHPDGFLADLLSGERPEYLSPIIDRPGFLFFAIVEQ